MRNSPGTQVYEHTFVNEKPLQKSTLLQLNWREILGKTPAAPLFVELVATAQADAPDGTVVNRAIVEFTDIGLLLKSTGQEALVYAFSLKTGEPLPGVDITLSNKERTSVGTAKTDAQGLVTLPSKEAVWALAKSGDDCTAVNFESTDTRIGLWGQGLNLSWESPWKDRYQALLFADRPVYKPGDTAHVKAIARVRNGDTMRVTDQPLVADLTVTDSRGRVIIAKSVTFTANGNWSGDIPLPDGNTGWYTVNLNLPKPAPAADAKPGDDEPEAENLGMLELRVDDYKPNTFEVNLAGAKFKTEPGHVKVPLSANYYMGKALSSAKVTWSANLGDDYTPPEAYAEYDFGDVPSFWHYGEDRDDETASDEDSAENWGANGELVLGDDGKVELDLPTPPPHKVSLPQTVSIYADVTDVNQQTISTTTEFRLPGADFIVGARKSSWYANAGKEFGIDFVAITPDGKPFASAVPLQVKIERQEWNTVRVEAAGGGVTTKNQSTLIEELKSTVQLASANGQASSGHLAFTPKAGGTYFMTATGVDASGKPLLTRVAFYTLGQGGFPWSWEDGAQMTLQPDKTSVKPGEEVSIVVKSPIAGKALVTVERNRIHRQFLTSISPENPVIKVKMDEEDAPNAFISVVVIRGSVASPQPSPMPEYKVGYCDITVESDSRRLFVDAAPSAPTILPGQEITLTASVKDAAKKPVEGAEVTLYAVDEGVLSLMTYLTPTPFEFFHEAASLAVSSYTTLDSLLKEALDQRYRGNKGILVGGGGDEGNADSALRKNFVATAVWQSALITDKDGKVTTTFKAPDSLTRYRIMAIATKDADRFGAGESAFVINKPLMVEPVVPRFAHTGDEILVKAVVHNTTTQSGQVEVELQLDDTASLISEQRPFALMSLKSRTMTNDGKSERRTIELKAGETTSLAFPVRFVKNGTSTWKWSARTTKWSDKPLADAVESKFEVTHPAPSLREVHYFELTHANAQDDLLKKVNPQLLETDGKFQLNLGQSRMSETRDALEYLLHYPYGCVEQTTSSMLPWLALSKYEPLFPDLLQKDKVTKAIARGTDRLLGMQTEAGGLSYWPGSDTPEFWATAYGGYALLKAKDWGMNVPQASMDKLTGWLSAQLRDLDLAKTNESSKLCDAALALYTLAKAGAPEPAYQTTLFSRRDKLPDTARAFLALSMCITKAPEKQITELIKPVVTKGKQPRWEPYWLGNQTADGVRLIVCAELGLTAEGDAIATRLLQTRNGQGHWGTTFSDAWVLLGLSTNERVPKNPVPLALQLTFNGETKDANLATPLTSTSAAFEYSKKEGAKPMQVSVPEGQTVRGRLELKAWPDLKTFQPVQKGFGLKRRYERLNPVGILEPAKDLRVGDLIVVTLEINVLRPNRYLALEDPLPSVFEPVNPEFTTQNTRQDAKAIDNAWACDYRELRNDKALFFTNEWDQKGVFELKYLARVIAEGDVIAPPARIEAMYEPDHYGLSEIQQVQTLPMGDGSDVAKK
ncbi:MAG: alpha-2-macroglobulin family protein [Chthoniobacteraceae bacterium]